MVYAGIIGYPLRHSLSPVFQQAAFDHLGLAARYELWETPPESVDNKVKRLRRPRYLGANVTIPYKEVVVPLLDELEPPVRALGAVNTVVNREGRLVGYNTDTIGFMLALREEGGVDPEGQRVVLLGAGGAARAIAFALLQAGVASLTIINRTPERARRLLHSLEPGGRAGVAEQDSQEASEALARCHLLVNATSVGMKHSSSEGECPLGEEPVPPSALVYDIVYSPEVTPLLRRATEAGARVLGGLPMLIYQGAASFELWTGQKAPLNIMFKAARAALGAS